MLHGVARRSGTPLLLLLLVVSCGGGSPPAFTPSDGGAAGEGKSYTAWAVAQGIVTAYALEPTTLARGGQLGTATTAADGSWSLALNAGGGGLTILVVVSSGAYTEPTTGTPIVLDDSHQLTAILPPGSWHAGDKLAGLVVSPVSHLAAQLSLYYATHGTAGSDAIAKASRLLNAHFGGLDWASVQPIDPTSAAAAGLQLNDQLKAGLLLAALSQEARTAAEAHGLTPGAALNSLSLVTALAQDLAGDSFFDGLGGGGAQLSVPQGSAAAYPLDGQTVRATLAQALLAFVSSAKNASKVSTADVQPLVSGIAGDTSADLFRSSGPVNVTPPAIAFLQPVAATTVRGSTTVDVTATAAAGTMSSFTFTAPDALKGVTASSESGGTVLHLRTPFEVGALADGPLSIAVIAKDSSGNVAGKSISITVANHGPGISVVSPFAGLVVKGTIQIAATASSNGGSTVTGLSLLNPPPGAGPNSLPAADALSINWDSTKALEGPYTLRLRATDSAGGQTDLDIPVVVDNVPFGVLHVALAVGGQPIQNAFVRVFAVRDSDGQADTTVGNAGELAPAAVTDKNGLATILLNTENRAGPVQLVAGGAALSFIDPSDLVTPITIPQTFQFTSFIGHYVDGTAISAPITEWTTLADVAALAYAGGQNHLHPGTHPLSEALAFSDPLFASHITSTKWDLRSTLPASLTSGAQQTLVDVTYAAMPGIGLNQLARDLTAVANVGTQALNAITLVQLLEQDLAADGQFDGFGAGHSLLLTTGNPRQGLDANTLRYSLAKALDEWFASSNNKSGIDEHTTLLNSGSLNNIANDTSDLFGSQTPLPFDNQPPVVTFAGTSFVGADGQTYSPVGPSQYIAGKFTLNVSASDAPAGVQSISVSANGSPVGAGSGSSLPTKLVAVIDTTKLSDGPLNVSVIAVDNYGNRGTTTTTYQVDNTPPAQTISGPADALPTKGGGDVHVLANATDAGAGLRSYAINGLNGFQDTDTSAAGITGTWDSSPQAEGTLHYSFNACDNVGNCSSTARTLLVDRTPPTVALLSPASAVYQRDHSIVLSVTASDAVSGVATVCARVTSTAGAEICGSQVSAGTWSVNVAGLNIDDRYTIAVYGKDNAGNSGFGSSSASAQQLVTVVVDTAAPAPALRTGLATYCDETGLQVAKDGSGRVVMQPQYSCVDPTLLQVDSGPTQRVVNKTVTRLSWGNAQPTADQIQSGATTINVPALFMSIPFSPSKEAPIASVSFTARFSGGGSGTASGNLLPHSDGTTWVLPIMADTMPPLVSVSGTATVTVEITATDRAGNFNNPPYALQFRFALAAPPVVAIEDTAYGSAGDPRRAQAFRVADNTYATMFNVSSTLFAPEGVRLFRGIVQNPGTVPVAVALAQGSGNNQTIISGDETWGNYMPADISQQGGLCMDYPSGACGHSDPPCGRDAQLAVDNSCAPLPARQTNPEMAAAFTYQTVLAVYEITASGEVAARQASNGGYLVPAASGNTPGQLAFYVGRPASVAGRQIPSGPDRVPSLDWDASFNRYQYFFAQYPNGVGALVSCGCDPDTGQCAGSFQCYTGVSPWYQFLTQARTVVTGSWSASSSNVTPGSSTAIGPSRAIVTAADLSRSIQH